MSMIWAIGYCMALFSFIAGWMIGITTFMQEYLCVLLFNLLGIVLLVLSMFVKEDHA